MRRKRRRTRRLHHAVNACLLALSLAGLLFIGWTSGWSHLLDSFSSTPVTMTAEQQQEPLPTGSGSEDSLPSEEADDPLAESASADSSASLSPQEETPQYREAVWMGVGDIMMHTPLLPGAYDAELKRYQFAPYFQEVKPILEQGDWVMANLETPVAGEALGFHGYPNFNAPEELLEAMRGAGISIATFANNHVLDQGEDGVLSTLEALKRYGFVTKGAAASQEEADTPVLIEHNGITMGLLAYTYGTNGHQVPANHKFLVSYIDQAKIENDIKTTREAGADFIVVALHFGTEYETVPNDDQETLARALIAAGADIIAGAHSHVLQPYEWVDAYTADNQPRNGLILYSMGNFLSNQRGETKDYGAIFQLTVRKYANEPSVSLERLEIIPTWVYRYLEGSSYQYRILPVQQTLANAASKQLTDDEYSSLADSLGEITERLDSML